MSSSLNTDKPETSLFQDRLWRAIAAGGAGGLIAAILDTFHAWETLHSSGERVLLFFHAAARSCFFGALIAAAAVGAGFVAERRARKQAGNASSIGVGPASLGISLLVAPGCVFTAWRLFQGGLTSRLPWRNLLMAAAVIVLLLLVYLGARVMLFFIRHADRQKRLSWIGIVAGVLFAAAAVVTHRVDGLVYRRLYLYLHAILGLMTLTGFGMFFRLNVFRVSEGMRRTRLRWVVGASMPVFFIVSLFTFGMRQTVKVAAFENTATLANSLQVFSQFFSFPVSSPGPGSPSAKIVELQRERERSAKRASQGDFPSFPGAHILMISVDALRADRLGVYGNTARDLSPGIDEWTKKNAVVFDRAYCSAPHSSYSISAIHTGRFIHDDVILKKEINFPTFARSLREAGYDTFGFYTQGIFFTEGDYVSHYRRNHFDIEHVFHGAPRPDELTDRAIAEIDRAVLHGEPPLFIWTHYFNVHEPYLSTKFGTSPADRYDGEILESDPEIVRLIAHAEKVLTKPLIVVFTADHGEEFKDHGGYYHGSSLYEEQVRIPLIFQVPDARPRRVSGPVTNIAIAPTILRLVGISPPSSMADLDLRPAIFGGDDAQVAAPVFSAVVNQHMVVRWPYKLIVDPNSERFELYDLKADPGEKFNQYDENRALADELRAEIEAFLDKLGKGESKSRTVLNLGNMRDPRAVPGLVQLMNDPDADEAERVEACGLLGVLRDYSTVPALERLLQDENEHVALAAALALGRLGNLSGEELMLDALDDDDASVRDKAALVLGNHGALEAVPQLIEALGRNDEKVKEDAIRTLGRLRDTAATDALLELLPESKFRYLNVLSIGMIADRKAHAPILALLDTDTKTDVRSYAVVAMGWMEAKEAIPRVLRVLAEEPEIRWTPETLVRLDAVGTAPLFGTDIYQDAPALRSGFGRCVENEKIVTNELKEFLNRTYCESVGRTVDMAFPVAADDETVLILRARSRLEHENRSVPLEIRVNGRLVGEAVLTGEFSETRIPVKKDFFHDPPQLNHIVLKLAEKGRFDVDHVLVLAAEELL